MISAEARVAFIRRIHLFQDLAEEDLGAIAAALKEEAHAQGAELYARGAAADKFFIIQQGGVRISLPGRGGERELAPLTEGDYFGEDALLSSAKRLSHAVATEPVTLLSLTQDELLAFARQHPKLKKALQVVLDSRRVHQTQRFDWRGPNEAIHFVARKHDVVLYQSLSAPIIALAAPVLLFMHFMVSRSFFAILGAGLLFVVIVGWAIWNWIDWGNDFYIVTNQRAIWLEKVIGLYDSRQEAPLATVLSVGVETDMLGRMLDYGDVVVRTYVGKIAFRSVAHPFEAARLVEEHWSRSKRSASRTEREAMRNVLRRKMGQPVPEAPVDVSPAPEDAAVTPSIYRRSLLQFIGERWLNLRVERGGSIIYHKHWFVLLQQAWQPTAVLLLLFGGMLARLIRLAQTPGLRLYDSTRTPPLDTTMLVLPTLLIPVVAWWIYQYMDWRNDVYVVTSDQIMDIDKTPFGTETRRSAPLENILSTEAERLGLPGYLMNFGTVYITVGGANLDFEGVQDPSAVQADIDRRRETRLAEKQELDASVERERISDWLIAYHENQEETGRRPDAERPPGSAGKIP